MTETLKSVVRARWFEGIVITAILLAGVLAGMETSSAMLAAHGPLLLFLDRVILGVFIVEITLKIASHGRRPWLYFRDGWNLFDFTIVALCLLPMDSQFAAVLRVARALRLMRLVTALPRLQLLVGALLKSLGSMGYVGLLLALLFYIYGVAGVNLFREAGPAPFGSLPIALKTLFQVITLDNWSDLYNAAREVAPVAAVIYFVSFILFGTMIMLNLFIGIIMNSMSEMHAETAERDRERHIARTGEPSLADDIEQLEQQIEDLKKSAHLLRTRVKATEKHSAHTRS